MNAFLATTDWGHFWSYGLLTIALGGIGAYFAWRTKRTAALLATFVSLLVLFTFIIGMWISQERPPMRTQGETRLFYSLFVILAGLLVYIRWGYRWIFSFSTIS